MRLFKLTVTAAFVLAAHAASAQTVLDSDPPRGALAPGQTVYVKCGPGKARMLTGGTEIKNGQMVAGGSKRVKGPCVPFKG